MSDRELSASSLPYSAIKSIVSLEEESEGLVTRRGSLVQGGFLEVVFDRGDPNVSSWTIEAD